MGVASDALADAIERMWQAARHARSSQCQNSNRMKARPDYEARGHWPNTGH